MPVRTDTVSAECGIAAAPFNPDAGPPSFRGSVRWRRYSPIRGRRLTPVESLREVALATRIGGWWIVTIVSRLDRRIMQLSSSRLSVGGRKIPTGLLETIGARTRRRRSVPLQFLSEEAGVLLAGSNGGRPRDPAWAHNLRANPVCSLTHGGNSHPYVAREIQGSEREEAWRRANDFYGGYEAYQRRAAGRLIPLFVLERRDDGTTAEPRTNDLQRCAGALVDD
jgi:deazaflavin-dependent oxidoreductase (nitroreductase family)